MIANSRASARKYLAGQLQAALTGEGKPAQAVYSYQVGDFKGQSPVVVVSSGGTVRERLTFQGSKPTHFLNIHVFILYADGTGTWTEENAEDALDAIEEIISKTLTANQKSQYWETITPVGTSQTTGVMIGGQEYRTEVITVRLA